MTLEEFTPVYNAYIADWLETEIAQLSEQLADADGDEGTSLEEKLQVLKFRQSLGDYLNFADAATLPSDLEWNDGLDQPEFADFRAKRGGVFYSPLGDFPPTLRVFGPKSNSGFRGVILDDIEVPMVGLHPSTGRIMPGLAKRWAVSEDKRTVYFELHPDITYSDGTALKIKDFHRGVFVRVSDYVNNPYAKQYFREQFAQITLFSDTLLAVTLPKPKPLTPYFAGVSPSPADFYQEYGPDFEQRYQWRPVPTTGAYHVLPQNIIKGVSISQTRVDNWWADDKKFYRYRYNPDVINHTVIRDSSKQFELFKIGKIDTYNITIPENFYEKSEIDPVFDGYIEKSVFYHKFTQIPRGFFLNMAIPKMQDINFRLGIHYATNWEKVISVVHRGDYARLQQFYQGFGELTNTEISARKFSITKAREHFKKAGYVDVNEEGYLVNANEEVLSVSLSYGQHPYYTKMLKIIQEEAKKAGLKLLLDANEGSVNYKIVFEKKHEMAFSGWGASPPFPNYYQFFHSSNAFDKEGNPKPFTNNINSYADSRMDELSVKARNASSIAELQAASMEAQQLLHDSAIFVPSYALDFVRLASWRWVNFPMTEEVKFSAPIVENPLSLHVHWIDEEMKRETLAAKRNGKTFPEKVNVYDQYRQKGGSDE